MHNPQDDMTAAQLVADFKTVVADAEALINATANHGDEKLAEIRAKAEESIKLAKVRLHDTQSALLQKAQEATRVTDEYVHANPWQSIGVAAGMGLLIGLLACRR